MWHIIKGYGDVMKGNKKPPGKLLSESTEAKHRVSKLGAAEDKLKKQLVKTKEELRLSRAQHKLIEKALKDSNKKYQAIFKEARNGITLVNINTGQIVECNPEFAKLTGRKISTLKKMKIWEFRPPNKQQTAKEMFQYIRAKGFGGSDELEFIKPGGEIVNIGFLSKKISIGGKEYLQSITWDNTERKQTEVRLRRSESQLRLLSQRILDIQEEERARIARELHDQLRQELAALKIEAISLTEKLVDNAELHERARALQIIADRLIDTTDSLSLELRPAVLDKIGLFKAIERCTRDFEHRTGISCPTSFNSGLNAPKATTTAAYRILQEALTNVRRHAKASQVKVKVSQENGSLVLSIIDNGIGVDISALNDRSSLGLLGMRERANIAGGTFQISSKIGKGTGIHLSLPVKI
jgi:PAS domain S-box-containing protein